MVELTQTFDAIFVALCDGTRRDIIASLRSGSARITEIASRYPVSLNAVSKHLKILERAGLIRREVIGREHWCSLDASPLKQVQRFVSQYEVFWNERLDRLESTLAARRKMRYVKNRKPGRSSVK